MPGLKNRCRGWNQMPKALQRGQVPLRRLFTRTMPPSWHPVPACVRYGILQAKPFSLAATENRIGRGPRCRYGHCRRAVLSYSSDDAASIRKSGPEIKNRCTQEGINRQNLASIRKSGLEIKNRCTLEGVNRQNLASIPKFGLEIKNRCTKEGVNGEKLTSIRKSGLEIKNHFSSKSVLQAEPFFSAATKIRIGRGGSSLRLLLQAGHSSSLQRN